jgi:hypothetical protein
MMEKTGSSLLELKYRDEQFSLWKIHRSVQWQLILFGMFVVKAMPYTE